MRFIYLIPFLLVLSCCVSKEEYKSSPQALTVMTYNVENLFDNLDDPGKDDETYLPIEAKKTAKHRSKCAQAKKKWWRQQCMETDWSETKIKRKLSRLADAILQIKDGKGPDLLILQEVENLNILERLRLNHLKAANYKPAILIEGPDKRGIDVAMLSRLPLKTSPKLHEVKLMEEDPKTNEKKEGRPTRGILQSQFVLPNGKSLTAFGVHFPSQGAPTPARKQAVAKLNDLKSKLPKTELVIAAGDFNITTEEDAKSGLFSKDLAEEWLVSHHMGCDNCEGTHNYRGKWSFLDAILFSKNFKSSSWKINTQSIRIANKSLYQVNHFGGPARFNDGGGQAGVSDHFPLAADILPSGVTK